MWQVPDCLQKADPEVARSMARESGRQQDHIELIASENFVSEAVLAAMGSVLTNKYAEGYPAHRYYAPASSTGRTTPTCSPTAAPRPTWPSTSPFWLRATLCWA